MVSGPFDKIELTIGDGADDTLYLIIEFADFLTQEELRRKAQSISIHIENELDIIVFNPRVDGGMSNFVVMQTATRFIEIQAIEDIREYLFGMSDYKNFIIATDPPEELPTLSRRS